MWVVSRSGVVRVVGVGFVGVWKWFVGELRMGAGEGGGVVAVLRGEVLEDRASSGAMGGVVEEGVEEEGEGECGIGVDREVVVAVFFRGPEKGSVAVVGGVGGGVGGVGWIEEMRWVIWRPLCDSVAVPSCFVGVSPLELLRVGLRRGPIRCSFLPLGRKWFRVVR